MMRRRWLLMPSFRWGLEQLREATQAEDRKLAGQQFRRDLDVHIRDISEKIPDIGETQENGLSLRTVGIDLRRKSMSIISKASSRGTAGRGW